MKKTPAQILGAKGGKARAKKMTAAQRKAAARKAWLASAKARKARKQYGEEGYV